MGQFLSTLGLGHIFQQGSGILDKAQNKLTKSGVAGSPWHGDFKKIIELLKDPDLWKISSKKEETDMKKRVDALKRSYDAVNRLGFKGSYTSFAKKIKAVHKPAFTFPGFGSGIDIQKHSSKPEELHLRTPTLKNYNYCGPGTRLEERLNHPDPKVREPIDKLDAICQGHDIKYSQAKSLEDKHKADEMLDEISKIPYKDRPWGTTAVQDIIKAKRKLGSGLD